MKIFSTSNCQAIDKYTIENEPILSIELMERAAIKLTEAIMKEWDNSTPITVFAGPGNNGGDALAVARLLIPKGYQVKVYLFNTSNSLSEDCLANKERIEENKAIEFYEISSQFTPPELSENDLVIDGLFGSGLNKPLAGGFAAVVKFINSKPCQVLSIDIPSGLMGEDNSVNNRDSIIKADFTFTIQQPKLSFFYPENYDFIGKCRIIDIALHPKGIAETKTPYYIVEEGEVKQRIKKRLKFNHKGTFGHGLLIAGSYGMAGASVLGAKAALKSGIGLLTVHAPFCNNNILQSSVPEAIVNADAIEKYFAIPPHTSDYSAIGIGPGLGREEETDSAVLETLVNCNQPTVIDADAINILAQNKEVLSDIPEKSILTPHPKELERLIGEFDNSYDRLIKASELAEEINCYIIIKGAWSVTVCPSGNFYFNPTGNVGMATAGSGDTLTGIILSLLAQGYQSKEASIIGTYVHGLAGDIAAEKKGIIGMTASDIIDALPSAWMKLG